jgi:hypothetical protein
MVRPCAIATKQRHVGWKRDCRNGCAGTKGVPSANRDVASNRGAAHHGSGVHVRGEHRRCHCSIGVALERGSARNAQRVLDLGSGAFGQHFGRFLRDDAERHLIGRLDFRMGVQSFVFAQSSSLHAEHRLPGTRSRVQEPSENDLCNFSPFHHTRRARFVVLPWRCFAWRTVLPRTWR